MNKPYSNETPMRRVAPLLILLMAAVAVILAAVSALSSLWNVQSTPEQIHAAQHNPEERALETAPQTELQEYQAQKQLIANSYAWIDAEQHLARIPVQAAIQALLAQKPPPAGRSAGYLMGLAASTAPDHNVGKDAVMRQRQGDDQTRKSP